MTSTYRPGMSQAHQQFSFRKIVNIVLLDTCPCSCPDIITDKILTGGFGGGRYGR